MDFMMPDMNGPEVTIVLREMGYVNPVIGLTANLMLDDINHFMNSGASLVMPKPFNFKDFKRMLIMPGVDI
jgi:CheY-like chemotaxis protein